MVLAEHPTMTTTGRAQAVAGAPSTGSHFPNELAEFVFVRTYARWDAEQGRRETWEEAVDRVVAFLQETAGDAIGAGEWAQARQAMLEHGVRPSSRLLAMAGPAARINPITAYNCSYLPIDSIESFAEVLYILMAGTGVGFSVERRYVEQLPVVQPPHGGAVPVHTIPDDTEGWADALKLGLTTWYSGGDIRFDYQLIRPAGAPLMTKGGRASGPEPLRGLLDFTRALLLGAQGRKLTSLECHDIATKIGDVVVMGGVRRSAEISLSDFDDLVLRHAKDGEYWNTAPHRAMANNSAVYEQRPTWELFQEEWRALAASGTGERGIFNRAAARQLRPSRREDAEFGTNPCVVGETWVAVADGRGRLQMADLVAEGKDVDVFTVKDGDLVIRTMRNPRRTGTQSPIYKVTFTDGTFIRVTPNHKFVLKDGSQVEAVNLLPNDALESMTVSSYGKAGLPQVRYVDYDQPGSYRLVTFGFGGKAEHRLVYQHHHGVPVNGIAKHIHHRDFDGRNNAIGNLDLVDADVHAEMHRARMVGQNNPVHGMTQIWRDNLSRACAGLANGNAKSLTNEELESAIISLVRKMGRLPSYAEYAAHAQQHELPLAFSPYRQAYFGGNVHHALQSIAEREKVPVGYEARAAKVTDLPVVFRDGRTLVVRACEGCGCRLEIPLARREQSFCKSCSMKRLYETYGKKHREAALRAGWEQKHPSIRAQQMVIYNDLVFELGRHPLKAEWVARCRTSGRSPEISRPTSPFTSWNSLQAAAAVSNHRVVSVEPDGYEDVFTGTVDDTHTYFAIGAERLCKGGRHAMSYVLNVQCGEISLRPFEFCNLSEVVARVEDTPETLAQKTRIATLIGTVQSMLIDFPYLRPQWRENCAEERLLGVSVTGQLDCPAFWQRPEVMTELRELAITVNAEYAARLGINASASITCVKPSGNASQMADCASGMHPRYAKHYVRRVRVSTTDPLYRLMRDAGAPLHPEVGQTAENATTWVVEFPVKAPDGAITRHDMSALEQLEYWLAVKEHFTEHNPSQTIYVGPDEWDRVGRWVFEHWDRIGGLSFLPRSEHIYQLAPYEDLTEQQYAARLAAFPTIDYSLLSLYELEDRTEGTREFACTGDRCELN
jgi:hypothetical protein